jgi:ABC-type Fe3+-siderophore transport system permease subunit
MYYALVAAAVFGVVRLRRRRAELLLLAAPVLVATLTALFTWGLVRIRHEAEVVILVLAGVGLSGILTRLCRRWGFLPPEEISAPSR